MCVPHPHPPKDPAVGHQLLQVPCRNQGSSHLISPFFARRWASMGDSGLPDWPEERWQRHFGGCPANAPIKISKTPNCQAMTGRAIRGGTCQEADSHAVMLGDKAAAAHEVRPPPGVPRLTVDNGTRLEAAGSHLLTTAHPSSSLGPKLGPGAPPNRRHLKGLKLKRRRDDAAHQRPITFRASLLPGIRRYQHLSLAFETECAGHHAIPLDNAKGQWTTRLMNPELFAIDSVPPTRLAAWQEKQDTTCHGPSTRVGRSRSPCLAVIPTFRMGRKVQPLDQVVCFHDSTISTKPPE